MKISLIIRTYNEARNIRECLERVLAQTRQADEVIIVDNRSEDETLAIAREFVERLPLTIVDNPERGYAASLNLGAQAAKYERIAYLSADCFPEPGWLAALEAAMEKYSAAVVTGCERVRGTSDIHYVLQKTRHCAQEDQRIVFFENSNILYDKAVLKESLPFIGIGSKQGGEDTLLSIRYREQGRVVYRAAVAIVEHEVYDSLEDFCNRSYQQGARLRDFFHHGWRYPRTYLNPFYWSLVEALYFFRYYDRRFLRIAYLRLSSVLSGFFGRKRA